ncbi:PREDICTED: uncharacterized protein LOC109182566 [Ipomoea nil]|uniref:uncharacterized protein LOC109182566 n=1 Tax=Ipomoea nil TaxID=35883 RepID=UPI000901696E|nr:PREDICTED: uncharacterized protein LOC109182566 [Ipomoea nil]
MAADFEQQVNRGVKRKMGDHQHCKLCEGQKVEVRSLEEGFLGSWHRGTVVLRRRRMCHVQYDHLLCDNGSASLVEGVQISSMIDGVMPAEGEFDNHRGWIRPLPPPLDIGKSSLHYGECVDSFYRDAWWEGVIFDHEDGSENRRIFFPDMGDEMTVCVNKLRITRDWDGVTEEWKPRGNWIFLELVKELEQKYPFLVSVRQVWFEVREKNGHKKEWNFPIRDYWRELLSLVQRENLKHTSKHFLSLLNSAEGFIQERQSPEFIDKSLSLVPNSEASSNADETRVLPNDTKNLDTLIMRNLDEVLSPTPSVQSSLPHTAGGICGMLIPFKNSEVSGEELKNSKRKSKLMWSPVALDAESFPEAIAEFKRVSLSNRRPPLDLHVKVRKHLLYLGWKVESVYDGMIRFRYLSPSGTVLMSLPQVCKELETMSKTLSVVPVHNQRSAEVSTSCSSIGKQETGRELYEPPSAETIIDSECCPRAVIKYVRVMAPNRLSKKKRPGVAILADKAKRHLVFSDWKIYSQRKGDRTELRYMSPAGKVFYSLITACECYIKEMSDAQLTGQRQIRQVGEDHEQLLIESGEKLKTSGYSGGSGCSKSRKKRKLNLYTSRASIRSGDVADSHSSTRVLRSSKRARQVASSSHQTPRSILSWLIDNNVILPRTKVHYRGREDDHPKREGRISHDGIKCICCQKVYGLSTFAAHAGSSTHCSSKNIILEDGRSIHECQREMKRKISARKTELHIKKGSKSDYVCSICHDGGELILCDRCPSAFHSSCLGLKELPDGDWFCPLCCCRICSQTIFDKNEDHFADNNALYCSQCEHQYHVACIRNNGLLKHPNGYWFCNNKCEQIFGDLHKLLGKPIQLGTDNLTLTLLKYNVVDDEHALENYSKLNIAIDVMHECFEPVKESRTGRDLMEDIVFSRWSELNRLNFQGFYTVILERNEELITVATLRVHGDKVAEIPLVATRFQYRRLGMCRILMNVLEKKLSELGVEKLVLPAATSVLNTWISSFGFSVMEESTRLDLSGFNILNFHGTVMCQKPLVRTTSPSMELIVSTAAAEPNQHIFGAVAKKGNAELDGTTSAVSEVLQAEQIDGSDIIDKGPAETPGGTGTNDHPAPLVLMLKETPDFPAQNTLDCSGEEAADKREAGNNNAVGIFKCYERRRRYEAVEANLLRKVVTDG